MKFWSKVKGMLREDKEYNNVVGTHQLYTWQFPNFGNLNS